MIKIAHIGYGYWGRNLARNLADLELLETVADNQPQVAGEIKQVFGFEPRSVLEVLQDSRIDAVTIATPAETHKEIALEALARGKHVFVEKPLTLSEEDSLSVIDAAKQADRQLMVGHLLQYHPIFRKLKALVDIGKVGSLQYVYSNRMSLGKFRTEEDVLWSFAPHDLSMILSLTGSPPDVVSAQGAAYYTPGIVDWATVQLKFPKGVCGHVQVSWLHPFKEQRLVVIGTKGMLVFEDSEAEWSKKLAFYPHGIDVSGLIPVPRKADVEHIAVDRAEPLREELQHFVDCVVHNRKPLTDGLEGLAVQRVLTDASLKLRDHLVGHP